MSAQELPTDADADAVNSREELAAYVHRIHTAVVNGVEIENATLDRYLEALGSWISDSPGFYHNTGRELPTDATWSFMAHTLSAALIYE